MADWADLAWSHRGVVEFDATYIDEAVPVVPVYLSGFDSNWWANVDSAGDDIRVYQEDGTTALDYYLASIDTVLKVGLIFVNVDGYISASTNKKIYGYCGNGSAAAGSDAAATFGDYAAFYLPGMTTTDLTGGGYDLTAVNTPGTTASGFEGLTAATYDGSSSYHYSSSPLGTTATMSFEGLAYADNNTHLGTVVAVGSTSSAQPLGILSLDGATGGDPARGLFRGNTGSTSIAYSATGFSAATWTYVSTTRNGTGGSTIAYISGGNSGSNSTAITTLTTNSISIGVLRNTSLAGYLDGNVAMAAVSAEVRSADYFATMYDAWFTSAFRTYGATDTAPASNDTGWLDPGTVAQSGTGSTWSNVSNALTNNGVFAETQQAALGSSKQFESTNYDFSGIPAYANIVGFAVLIDGYETEDYSIVYTSQCQLMQGGSLIGDNIPDGSAWFDTNPIIGGSSELFGLSGLKKEDIDDSTFGVAIVATKYAHGDGATPISQLDVVQLKVYYTEGSAPEGAYTGGMFPIL